MTWAPEFVIGCVVGMVSNLPSGGEGMAFAIPLPLALAAGVIMLFWLFGMWTGKGGLGSLGMMLLIVGLVYMFCTNVDLDTVGAVNPCVGADMGISRGGDCIKRFDGLGGGQ